MFSRFHGFILELDKVGIMDSSHIHFTGTPVEGCMAVDTPHLCTPTRLMDDRTAFGTRFAILVQKLHRLDNFLVTLMTLDAYLVTLFTEGMITQTTEPILIEKPFTFFHGTLSYKLSRFIVYQCSPASKVFEAAIRILQLPVK
jgi:hypothetical protein